jgi:hypothetical protein
MVFALINALVVAVLFATMYALQEWGRRIGERAVKLDPSRDKPSAGAADAAVYGLLGLFLAFTFSGAATRFDDRRHLIVDEANAIGTAWLRIDLLPPSTQPQLRDLFRRYLDARLERYGRFGDVERMRAAGERFVALQAEIWRAALSSANVSGEMPPFTVLLPSLNEMFDVATTREAAVLMHPPPAVFGMMGVLALIGALFAGYAMAGKPRSWVHALGYVGVTTMAIYVIVDLEFPRLGLIRVDASDRVLIELRESMD